MSQIKMKLTKSKLREMIREEIKILKEGGLEDAHWNMDKWMPNERDLMDEFHEILNISNKSKRLKELISFLEDEAHEDILYKYLGKKSIKDLAKHIIKKEA